MKKLVLALLAVMMVVSSCIFPSSQSEDSAPERYRFAADMLDAFFIFRNKLPPDLYAFEDPLELYQYVNEPFTKYYPPDQRYEFFGMLSTVRSGVGIRVDSVSTGYVVLNVFPNAPAQKGGILVGDTLTFVGSVSLEGITFKEFGNLLYGEVGDKVSLTVKRSETVMVKELTYALYSSPTVFWEKVDSATAFIQVLSFLNETAYPGGTSREFSDALDSTVWAQTLILDLRNNGGGYLTQCEDVISHLVEPGTAIINSFERGYDAATHMVFEDSVVVRTDSGGKAVSKKLLVLMNEWTASASEVVIAGLKSARPDVVTFGTRTYGKARGQIYGVGPDSCVAKVTSLLFWPVSGAAYDLVGIQPDISVESDLAFTAAQNYLGDQVAAKVSAGDRRRLAPLEKCWKPLAVKQKSDLLNGER